MASDRKRVTIFGVELDDKQEQLFLWVSIDLLIAMLSAYNAGRGAFQLHEWGRTGIDFALVGWFLFLANDGRKEIETIHKRKGRDA